MPPEAHVVAVHGWGFDRSCWTPWMARLRAGGVAFDAYDRGYFGAPARPVWDRARSGARVLVVHSMGLLWLDEALLARADVVLLLGCFRRFHPGAPGARERSREALGRMKARLPVDPEGVLRAFRRRCGLPRSPGPGRAAAPPGRPDVSLLARDLELLDSGEADVRALAHVPALRILHGGGDGVVPPDLGAALAAAAGPRAAYGVVAEAGHALPFTHVAACLEALAPPLPAGA